jgi:hypothetical protein
MILQTAVGTAFNAEKPKPSAEPTRMFHQESIGSAWNPCEIWLREDFRGAGPMPKCTVDELKFGRLGRRKIEANFAGEAGHRQSLNPDG